jgi:hypothetical protein
MARRRPVVAGRFFQKSDRVSLNNSNAMNAAHAALAIRPTGMVAITSAFRTIYIPKRLEGTRW